MTTPANQEPVGTTDRELLADAWDRWCDVLRAQGHRIVERLDDVDNRQELAEALRALGRLSSMAMTHRLDFDDPDFPSFFRALDDRYKYAGPDTYITYLGAQVRGSGTYRIRGNHHGRELQLGRFWNHQLERDDDDSFEIIASAREHEGNWHPLEPTFNEGPRVLPDDYPMAGGGFGGRLYFQDPADTRPIDLTIERIDPDRPRQPEPLTPERLAHQLDEATTLLDRMAVWWLQRASNVRTEHEPNVIGPPGTQPPGVPSWSPPQGSPLNYGVLVVTSDLPECAYWSFQLHNAWWESPDNQHRQTSVSNRHAHVDADGRFRAVLSHRDPGVPNWLDTGGSRRGFLFYRWLSPTTGMPTPEGVVTTVDGVRQHLPADHPVVDQAARRSRRRPSGSRRAGRGGPR
jgi:hypothetical protein